MPKRKAEEEVKVEETHEDDEEEVDEFTGRVSDKFRRFHRGDRIIMHPLATHYPKWHLDGLPATIIYLPKAIQSRQELQVQFMPDLTKDPCLYESVRLYGHFEVYLGDYEVEVIAAMADRPSKHLKTSPLDPNPTSVTFAS